MTVYLFCTVASDGVVLSFKAVEHPDDAAAVLHCASMFEAHRSAGAVEVWDDARFVHKAERGVTRARRPLFRGS